MIQIKKKPSLDLLIEDYIYDGFTSFKKFTEYELSMMTIAAIDDLGDFGSEAITEHDDFWLVLHHLKMYLKTAKKEYAGDLAETMAKNATEHFANKFERCFHSIMKELFPEREVA